MSFELPRFRAMTGALLAAVMVVACTGSEPVSFDAGWMTPGTAGTQGSGAAGTGSSSGVAGTGSSTGAAGTGSSTGASGAGSATGSGVAGSTGSGSAGHGGTTGAAGAGSGAAGTGTTGAAGKGGSGAAGTTGAAGTGSSTGAAGTGALPLTYTAQIENMLIQACGGCHFITPSVPFKGGFGISYANLMGSVTSDHMNCQGLDATKKRVVPGKPDNSMIVIKVSGNSTPSGCGGHMPYMGTNMSAEYQALLRQWIMEGAKQ